MRAPLPPLCVGTPPPLKITDYYCVMGTEEFEPVSEVAGNIEIVLNKKNPEWDPYVPVNEQIQFSIAKTGRSNKINFDNVTSETIQHLIDALEAVKENLDEVEFEEQNEEFNIDMIESGVENELESDQKAIIKFLAESGAFSDPIDKDKLVEDQGFEKEDINELMNRGRIFYPQKGKVKLIPDSNSKYIIAHLIEDLSDKDGGAEIKKVISKAVDAGIDKEDAKNQIENLKRVGELFEPQQGYIQSI